MLVMVFLERLEVEVPDVQTIPLHTPFLRLEALAQVVREITVRDRRPEHILAGVAAELDSLQRQRQAERV